MGLKAVSTKDREDALATTEGQCEMYKYGAGGGRCARQGGKVAIHHQQLKSAGGSNEPENLAGLCLVHHRAVHLESDPDHEHTWLYRVATDDGDNAFATVKGGDPLWFLWGNMGHKVEQESTEEIAQVDAAVTLSQQSGWRIADHTWALAELGDAWQLHGHDNVAQFAKAVGKKPKTLKAYLLAESRLDAFINPRFWGDWKSGEGIKGINIRLMLSAGKELTMCADSVIEEMLERAGIGEAVGELIRFVKEAARTAEAEATDRRRATVRLGIKAGTLIVAVTYEATDDPVLAAQAKVEAMEHVHVIEWDDAVCEVER